MLNKSFILVYHFYNCKISLQLLNDFDIYMLKFKNEDVLGGRGVYALKTWGEGGLKIDNILRTSFVNSPLYEYHYVIALL